MPDFLRAGRTILRVVDKGVRLLFTYVIKFYQKTLSQFFGSSCRFSPSCSCYAVEALKKKSTLHAFFLIGVRISKCHPYHPGGYDPVN